MPSHQLTKFDIRARGIIDNIRDRDILCGLAEIAAYMGWSPQTVKRYIYYDGFPATNTNGASGKRYITSKTVIQDWIKINHCYISEERQWRQLAETRGTQSYRRPTDK